MRARGRLAEDAPGNRMWRARVARGWLCERDPTGTGVCAPRSVPRASMNALANQHEPLLSCVIAWRVSDVRDWHCATAHWACAPR
eukprot:1622900-Prymnesium_polylepis.1